MLVNAKGISLVDQIYPVGSIYMSTVNKNPNAYFGGTWVSWGSGRVPVGVNANDTNFNTVEKTGGFSKTVHVAPFWGLSTGKDQASGQEYISGVLNLMSSIATEENGVVDPINRVTKVEGRGGSVWDRGTTNTEISTMRYYSSNLQPYITCYMWKRTA